MLNDSNKTRDSVQNIILFFIDVLGVLIAYYVSGMAWLFVYKNMGIDKTIVQLSTNLDTIIVAALVGMFFTNGKGKFLKRGRFDELRAVICKVAVFAATAAVYELITRKSQIPRGVYVCTVLISVVLILVGRELMKKYLKGLGRNEHKAARVIAITMKDRAKHLVDNLDREEDWVRTLAGFVVMDEDMVGQEIDGVKVVANAHSMMTYIKNEIVDEVYIDVNESIRSHLNPMVMHLEDWV